MGRAPVFFGRDCSAPCPSGDGVPGCGDLSLLRAPATPEKARYEGVRHAWNALAGTLAPEVLAWLRGCPGFARLLPLCAARAPAFGQGGAVFACRSRLDGGAGKARRGKAAKQKAKEKTKAKAKAKAKARALDWRAEAGRKVLLAGKLGGPSTGDMCGLALKHSLVLPRVEAWRNAFLSANRGALEDMWAEAHRRLRVLSFARQGRNGRHFLRFPIDAHFLSCGEVHVTWAGSAEAGYWDEPRHRDGAASVVHLSLTLFGRRDVRCEQSLPARSPWPAIAEEAAETKATDLEGEEEAEQEDEEGTDCEEGSDGRRTMEDMRAEGTDCEEDSAEEGAEQVAPEQKSGMPEVVLPCVPGTVYLGQASRGILRRRPPLPMAEPSPYGVPDPGVSAYPGLPHPSPPKYPFVAAGVLRGFSAMQFVLSPFMFRGVWRGPRRNASSSRAAITKSTTGAAKRASSFTGTP